MSGQYGSLVPLSVACMNHRAMVDSSLHQPLVEKFLHSERLSTVDQKFKLAGVIALSFTKDGGVHFSWGHTTESMCIGYMSQTLKEAKVAISKMEDSAKAGLTAHVEAVKLSST